MRYNPSIVLSYFKECGIPESLCLTEHKFHPERKWRFDFAFTVLSEGIPNVALEVEGGIWTGGAHGRGSGIKRDMEKYNEAAALGWRIIRVQPKDLCTQETINLIKRCLNL